MKNTYTPFIWENEFPIYTPRGYKKRYIEQEIEDDSEEVVPVIETEPEEIDFSLPVLNYKFEDKESFKSRMLLEYKSALQARGIDSDFAKALVAQDGLESAWGSKPSGTYNYGGIKGKGTVLPTSEFIDGEYVNINDSFRNFSSIQEYVNYKIDLLNSPRYRAFSGDVSEFADRVKRGGYATAPDYVIALNNIINSMKRGGVLRFNTGGLLDKYRDAFNRAGSRGLLFGHAPYNIASHKIRIENSRNGKDNEIDVMAATYKHTVKDLEDEVPNKYLSNVKEDESLDSPELLARRMLRYMQDVGYAPMSARDTIRFVSSEKERLSDNDTYNIYNRYNELYIVRLLQKFAGIKNE